MHALDRVGGFGQQLLPRPIGGGNTVQQFAVGLGVAADGLAGLGHAAVAVALDFPRRGRAGGYLGRAFGGRRQGLIAFPPLGPNVLKTSRPKPCKDPPGTLGGHLCKKRTRGVRCRGT